MSDECSNCSQSGSCDSTPDACGQNPDAEKQAQDEKLNKQLSRIKHKIVVLSGKGGVGKSTVAVNIAVALAQAGKTVGLLDVDVHGPSIPRLLSLGGKQLNISGNYMEPVPYTKNLWVVSLGFMLPDADQAVIWRGPVKMGLIRQFVQDVSWGDLDFLVVDCPPGTGDEPLSTLQTLGTDALAVIVTTPQGLAVDDVRRSVSFVREVGNPILGMVENMSGFVCSECGHVHNVFGAGGGEELAKLTKVPFLGRIPLDPEVVRAGDEGYPVAKVQPDSPVGKALTKIIEPILKLDA